MKMASKYIANAVEKFEQTIMPGVLRDVGFRPPVERQARDFGAEARLSTKGELLETIAQIPVIAHGRGGGEVFSHARKRQHL